MSDFITTALNAEVLTQQMPLSAAFNKSQAGHVRAGVHHGLTLAWSDANWPLKKHATRYLKIRAGKAMVSPLRQENATSQDQVMITVELTSDVIIDLEALSVPIGVADASLYYVVLKITYTPSSVNNSTGLVVNPGTCVAKFVFETVASKPGWATDYGVVLGKFSRAQFHLEELRNSSMARTDISSESPFTDLPEVAKDVSTAGIADLMMAVNLTSYHGVGKRIQLRGLKDQDIGATVMPLTEITNAIAMTIGQISHWKKAVDWLNDSVIQIYRNYRIWKDVGVFELFDSYFSGDLNLAFHRTPGHSMVQNMVTDAPINIADESLIRAMTDYGMKSMVIDMKGTVIEGDLTLDLVLDFTGNPHDLGVFRLFLRNVRVKGDLTVNLGQSWLGMAGGAQGVIEVENVVSYGLFNIRPWPQVRGVNADSSVTPVGTPAFPAWCNTVAMYLNNAGNISFTNYTLLGAPDSGPLALRQWRRNLTAGASAWTKGPLIPVYLHAKTAGTGGDYAMDGDPWLTEGAEGGIRLKGSSVPEVNLLGESIHAVTGMSPAPAEQIRVLIQNCLWWKTRPAGSSTLWNLADKPTVMLVASSIYKLSEYKTGNWKYVAVEYLTAAQTVLGNTLQSVQDVVSGRHISALLNIVAGLNVTAGVNLIAGTSVYSDSIREKTSGAGIDLVHRVLDLYIGKTVSATNPAKFTAYRRVQAFAAAGALGIKEWMFAGTITSLAAASEVVIVDKDELERALAVNVYVQLEGNIYFRIGVNSYSAAFAGMFLKYSSGGSPYNLLIRPQLVQRGINPVFSWSYENTIHRNFMDAAAPRVCIAISHEGDIYLRNANTADAIADIIFMGIIRVFS